MDVEKGLTRRGAAGTLARSNGSEPTAHTTPKDVPVTAIPVPAEPSNGNGAHHTGPRDERPAQGESETRLRYLPGLDGLRAVSVLAVLAYHWRADNSLLRGGFLGVEVFFVISGYLITSLLLAERRRRGEVSLKAFWLRRARRLAPALAALILVTGLFVAIFHNSELHANRGDLLFGFWGENWWSIFHHALYNEQGVRQPLQHLWSLAVEEQFYLVWPLVFIAGMAMLGRKRMPYAVAALAAVSWLGSIVWLHASTQSPADLQNTLYVSALSRAYPLLLGALAAFLAAPDRFRGTPAPSAPRALNIMGLVALALLAVEMVFATLQSHALFYFGLLLTDVLTLAIIVAVVHPASSWNRWLGMRPLRAIGVRSYGIYLWGVVVLQFTRPGVDVHWSPAVLFVVRFVIIAGLVEASYRWLEMPVRRGALGRAYRELRESEGTRHEVVALRWMVAVATILVLAVPLGVLAAVAQPSKAVNGGQTATGGGDRQLTQLKDGGTLPPVPTTVPHPGASTPTTKPKPGRRVKPLPHSAQFTGFPNVWSSGYIVTAVGDSVMLGANLGKSKPLEKGLNHIVGPGVWVNAEESRQAPVCAEYLQLLARNHQLGPIVIVHCDDNGYITNHFVSDVMHIAGPKRHVVFVTAKVERPWEIPNNQMIVSQAKNYKNAKVLDWYFFGTHANQGQIFVPEFGGSLRLHLTQPAGARFYTNVVINTLRKWGWLPYTVYQ